MSSPDIDADDLLLQYLGEDIVAGAVSLVFESLLYGIVLAHDDLRYRVYSLSLAEFQARTSCSYAFRPSICLWPRVSLV